MSQETELQSLREELKEIHNQARRSRRRATIGFVILLLVVIVSFVFAFVQRSEAMRTREEAHVQRELAEKVRAEADRNAAEAKRQQQIAIENMAVAQRLAAELAACSRKK
jgi:hypothetical protein